MQRLGFILRKKGDIPRVERSEDRNSNLVILRLAPLFHESLSRYVCTHPYNHIVGIGSHQSQATILGLSF
jgi:hypothetical protein